MQQRLLLIVADAGVGSVGKQQLHNRVVFIAHGAKQRRVAVVIHRVHLSSVL